MIGQQSLAKAPAGKDQKDQPWRVAGLCLILAVITFAVFGQTAGFGFVNFDDNDYVYENTKVASGLSLKGFDWVFTHADCDLYHPLTMLSLMADYQLHGLRAGGYHFTNVLLHASSVILLFLIFVQMTGVLWRSAFVAAVFAIHPLRVESVAWVAERKDVLGGFFFMLTLGAYVYYVHKPNSLARYLMVAAAFVLALLSKPTVVTLPFVLLLLDYWPLQRTETRKFSRLILEKIPLSALATGGCAMTVLAARQWITPNDHVSLVSRLGNALVSYMIYLRQMVWPERLAVPYLYPQNGLPPWEGMLAGVLLAGLSAIAWATRRTRPWLLIGWLWYLGMLMPMLGIVQVGAFAHADRNTYLPQIGIYVALTWLVAEWRPSRVALGCVMAAVLALLMVCAWKQTMYWQSSETLWTHTLDCTTGNYIAHGNLAGTLLEKGRVDEAITQYQEALQINPDDAEAHFNLGNALRQKGRMAEAIAQYQEALRIQPNYAKAQVNLGNILLQTGKADEAVKHFQTALEINPNRAGTHYNLGLCFFRLGRMDEAISQYQKALQIEPADPAVLNNMAWLLATCSEVSLRDGHKAVQLARQADALTGGENPVMLHTLAAALAEDGQFPEAVETAQHALQLAEAQSNNGLARQLQAQLKLYQAGTPIHP